MTQAKVNNKYEEELTAAQHRALEAVFTYRACRSIIESNIRSFPELLQIHPHLFEGFYEKKVS